MTIEELQTKLSALRDLILYKEVVEQTNTLNLPQYRTYKKLIKEMEKIHERL